MTNVIHVRFPTPEDRQNGHLGPIVKSFSQDRRATTDAFWLKENGELLNILETTAATVPQGLISVYDETYANLPAQMAFFPQYYRFLLSIALDLEALDMKADVAERLCAHVLRHNLIEGETSDIQRLEAQRLLQRRGYNAPIDVGVHERALTFINTPERFALPNKKAAYELTHIVFYLTQYGRTSIDLGPNVRQSLENVGIWAFLDGNVDLLAEICIAMRYLSYNPTEMWEDWIALQMKTASAEYATGVQGSDGYHCVFMGTWLAALRGTPAFSALAVPQQPSDREARALNLFAPTTQTSALRELSRHLYTLGSNRSGDWARMAPKLTHALTEASQERLQRAANASNGFERFFESFARAVPA